MTRVRMALVTVGLLGVWSIGCDQQMSSETGPTEGFVCGADGKTYSLEDADESGGEIRHRGRCDEPMRCESPDDCFVGDECMPGSDAYWCMPGPTRCNCPGLFEPVCGGDGRNYINACEAACAGVGARHEGYCQEPPGEGCVRAGCSSHLCVEEGMDIASTCEWRPVYECYQQAVCERQKNDQCGFTPTHELVECLERHGEGMCRIDPRWQSGFTAECESPQVPGIVGRVSVVPHEPLRIGEWFPATFQLLEPSGLGGEYPGEGVLLCEGSETEFHGFSEMNPLGPLEFSCRILRGDQPGECFDDGDCPPGHYCERSDVWRQEGIVPDLPPGPGICVDLCVLIDCAPGYRCEAGECIPEEGVCRDDADCPPWWICREGVLANPVGEGVCEPCACVDIYAPVCGVDGQTYGNGCEARCAHVEVAYEGECRNECPVETHVINFAGECVPKCYGPEQCGDEQHCNAPDVCLQDPACPECDVCVGWCVPPAGDCRTNGCEAGWTCDYCRTADGGVAWICLSPEAGACEPPDDLDCRAKGCGEGEYCTFCWFSWECIPEGAVC